MEKKAGAGCNYEMGTYTHALKLLKTKLKSERPQTSSK